MKHITFDIEKLIFSLILISFLFSFFSAIFVGFQALATFLFIIYIISRKSKLNINKSDYLLVIFFLIVLIKSFFVKDFQTSFISSLLIPFYILIFLFYKNFTIDNIRLKKIIIFISYGLIAFNAFALFHYFIIRKDITFTIFSNKIIIPHSHSGEIFSSISSILFHPTGGGILIGILISLILLWLAQNFKSTTIKEKVFFSVALFLSMITLFFTFSRSGYIILILSILFIIFYKKKFILFIPLIALSLLFTILNPGDKIQNTITNFKNSYNIPPRFIQYEIALKLFKKSPITGIGLMQFKNIYKNSYNTPEYNHYPSYYFETVEYVHNNYLALLTETGIVGFLIFYLFLILKLINILRTFKEENNQFKIYGLFFILWFLIDSIFNAHLYVTPIGIFLWISMGLSENKKGVS